MEEGGEYIYSTDSVNFEGTEEEKAKVTIDNSTTAEASWPMSVVMSPA